MGQADALELDDDRHLMAAPHVLTTVRWPSSSTLSCRSGPWTDCAAARGRGRTGGQKPKIGPCYRPSARSHPTWAYPASSVITHAPAKAHFVFVIVPVVRIIAGVILFRWSRRYKCATFSP